MDQSAKHREFEALKARVEQLEEELAEAAPRWQPGSPYPVYDAASGFVLGSIGAAAALLVNVIGAPIVGKHPLELIRVYLTFPLGEKALALADPLKGAQTVSDGMVLAFGCCLYLATGMLLGIPFHMLLSRLGNPAPLKTRLLVATGLALAVWVINFYLILAWLQPLLFGGRWIVDSTYLPWWVGAGTHLIFGWTMAFVQPWGRVAPPPVPAETA
ncbi:MAG: hypothetical protein ACKV0T_21495 [Planctomycetales bacterium]